MPDDLVPVASYETPFEAHAAKGALTAAGIAAQVADENVAGALFHVGTALGGVKVLVWHTDLVRAQVVLFGEDAEEDGEQNFPRERWKCAQCKEWNEPSFDLCWSCGADCREDKAHPDDEAEATDDTSNSTGSSLPASFADESLSRAPPLSPEEAANPYAPGRLPAKKVAELNVNVTAEIETDPEIEKTITRAWRAAVIGLVFCPGILHFYSMCLLWGVSPSAAEHLSPESRRWFYATLALDVCVLLLIGLTLWIAYLTGRE